MVRARIAESSPGWASCSIPPPTPVKAAISRPQSRVAVYVIPTDEESMIARHTLALISLTAGPAPREQWPERHPVPQDGMAT